MARRCSTTWVADDDAADTALVGKNNMAREALERGSSTSVFSPPAVSAIMGDVENEADSFAIGGIDISSRMSRLVQLSSGVK
jgi:hypothetical protein